MWNKMVEQPLTRPQFKLNLNLMKKQISFQYLILGCWLVAASLIVYYLTYNMVILEMVQSGILPVNIDWSLYLAAGFGVLGFCVLLLSPDQISPQ